MAGLKMPHAIEILYATVRRLERVEVTALGASTSCSPKSSCERTAASRSCSIAYCSSWRSLRRHLVLELLVGPSWSTPPSIFTHSRYGTLPKIPLLPDYCSPLYSSLRTQLVRRTSADFRVLLGIEGTNGHFADNIDTLACIGNPAQLVEDGERDHRQHFSQAGRIPWTIWTIWTSWTSWLNASP